MENVEDFFEVAMARRRGVFLQTVFSDTLMTMETPLEREYIPGLHKEPKPGALPAPGNRYVPPAYIFSGGKRLSTGRSQRFAKS